MSKLQKIAKELATIAREIRAYSDPYEHPEDNPWLEDYDEFIKYMEKKFPDFKVHAEPIFWDTVHQVSDDAFFNLEPARKGAPPDIVINVGGFEKKHYPLERRYFDDVLRALKQ